MAGIEIKINDEALNKITTKLEDLARSGTNMRTVMAQIGEKLVQTTRLRFDTQQSPDGVMWPKLEPATLKKKHKNANKILTLRGYLRGSLRWQADNNSVEIGTNKIYAAIHQFGGDIKMPAKQRTLYFKHNNDGSIGNKFVEKKHSNFAQTANARAYTVNMPARPFLGVSKDDENQIAKIINNHIKRALN